MKRFLWAGALALPFLFLTSEAKAFCIGGCDVDCGAKLWCNVKQFNLTMPTAGPWYLYWPYQAHFITAAPGVNPYFPPMTLPPGFGIPPARPPMPPADPRQPPQGYRPPMPAPAGYYPQAPQAYQPQPQQQAYYGYQYQPQPQQAYYGYQPQQQGYPYYGR
jgi:hypothetical protein